MPPHRKPVFRWLQNLRLLIFILLLLSVGVSCSSVKDKSIKENNDFDTLSAPLDSSILYFQTTLNSHDSTPNTLDSFENTLYSKMLFGLREPILSDYHGDKEIYRLTWLRTFHHPVSVRLEKQNEVIMLFSKVSNGAAGYEPGQLIFDTVLNVAKEQYKQLTRKLDEIGFWELPTEQPNDMVKDGSNWILEVVKDNNYHMVTRWNPRERVSNFRIVGEYLITISKIDSNETKNFY